ncbi:MAG: hypothetical protein HKL84_01565 [Acidimicrobiaceae bacterium]|nr:hypothetical protein [Acidimicrobiaceae bacterium]
MVGYIDIFENLGSEFELGSFSWTFDVFPQNRGLTEKFLPKSADAVAAMADPSLPLAPCNATEPPFGAAPPAHGAAGIAPWQQSGLR